MWTTQRTVVITVLVLVIAAIAYAILFRDNEPRYQGKSLSEWLTIYTTNATGPSFAPAEAQREAELAIRSIGTKALPFVLEWMRYEPWPWLEAVAPAPVFKMVFGDTVQKASTDRKKRAMDAVALFFILRTEAISAIPELETIMKDNPTPRCAQRAIYSLAWIGPPAIPALTNALADASQSNRNDIVVAMTMMTSSYYYGDTYRGPCLPAILQALNDPDRDVRRMATNFLEQRAPEALTNAPPQ